MSQVDSSKTVSSDDKARVRAEFRDVVGEFRRAWDSVEAASAQVLAKNNELRQEVNAWVQENNTYNAGKHQFVQGKEDAAFDAAEAEKRLVEKIAEIEVAAPAK